MVNEFNLGFLLLPFDTFAFSVEKRNHVSKRIEERR